MLITAEFFILFFSLVFYCLGSIEDFETNCRVEINRRLVINSMFVFMFFLMIFGVWVGLLLRTACVSK